MTHRFFRKSCRWALMLVGLGQVVSTPSLAQDDRDQLPIVIQEWSLWVGSPAQQTLNSSRASRNVMPSVVGTTRPKQDDGRAAAGEDGRFPIAPVSIIRAFGEPSSDVDIELRVSSGSVLAHWPPSRERAGSLRWFGADLSREPPADLPLAFFPESHPFQALREGEGQGSPLFLRSGSSVDRMIAYDTELTTPIPLKLRGGPDEYTLQNVSRRTLRDVAVIVPTETGFRIGWLDELPAAVDGDEESEPEEDESDDEPKSDDERAQAVFDAADATDPEEDEPLPPLPAEADPTLRARVDQALNRQVTVDANEAPLAEVLDQVAGQARVRIERDDRALSDAGIDSDRPTTLQEAGLSARDALAEILGNAGLSYRVTETGSLFVTTAERLAEAAGDDGPPPEGPPIHLTLSQPLPADDPSYVDLARDAFIRRLIDRGIREDDARTMLDALAPNLFHPDGLIVLAHLAPEAIDDLITLDVFPPPERVVRVSTLIIHGIDPRLQDQARTLVDQLGDPSFTVREEAETLLIELGPVAVPALEDALIGQDLEIVFRAERLLLRLNRPVP